MDIDKINLLSDKETPPKSGNNLLESFKCFLLLTSAWIDNLFARSTSVLSTIIIDILFRIINILHERQ